MVNQKELIKFGDACDAFAESKLILSDKKIQAVLKAISESKDLCDLVAACLEGFHYEDALRTALKFHPEKKNKKLFVLPSNTKSIVALVFRLLYDFDNGNLDFTDFLTLYFGLNELFTNGYRNFSRRVIEPFKSAVLTAALDADALLKEAPAAVCAEKEEEVCGTEEAPESDGHISEEGYFTLSAIMKKMIEVARTGGFLPLKKRVAFEKVLTAFMGALLSDDHKNAGALLAAMEIICGEFGALTQGFRDANEILKKEGMLNFLTV